MNRYRLPITEDAERVLAQNQGSCAEELVLRNAVFKLKAQCKSYGERAGTIIELLDFGEDALRRKQSSFSLDILETKIDYFTMALSHIRMAERCLVEILGVYA